MRRRRPACVLAMSEAWPVRPLLRTRAPRLCACTPPTAAEATHAHRRRFVGAIFSMCLASLGAAMQPKLAQRRDGCEAVRELAWR